MSTAKMPAKRNKPAQRQNNGMQVSQSWSGPIPPPAALENYEHVLPGAAERILSMAEAEQVSRHKNDRAMEQLVEKEMEQSGNAVLRGQIIGFVAVSACVGTAFASAWCGFHPMLSVSFLAVPVLSAVKAIINRSHHK